MSHSTDTLSQLPKFWQLWRNPIFHRYRRSRIRLSSLITGGLLYGGTSLFFYLAALGFISTQTESTMEESAIYPFACITFLQIFILNFVGTGEVASGMARESIDEVLTYQRLTPLSPATKIVGYLFGLPVRQFYHFAITLPVAFLIIQSGNIPIEVWGPIYTVLFTSTIMFYLLAMSVGFIMGKRFSALISQGLVALLYFALPQLSNFGFVIFEYLTIRPTVFSAAQKMSEHTFMESQYAMFYNWEITHTTYCIVLQLLIALAFYCLMLRRWKMESSHLLSKMQCVTVVLVLHIIMMGGIWANTANGSIFEIDLNARSTQIAIAQGVIDENVEVIAAMVLSLYGLISFAAAILMQYIYTPDKFRYLAGLRERHKRNQSPYAIISDSASGVPTTFLITMITTAAWVIYGFHVSDSDDIKVFMNGSSWVPISTLIITVSLTTLLAHGFTLEYLGKKLTATIAFFAWVIPLAIAVLLSAWSFGERLSSFLYGFSPLSMDFSPGYLLAIMHLDEDPTLFITGCRVGIVTYITVATYALAKLIMRHRQYLQQRTQVSS